MPVLKASSNVNPQMFSLRDVERQAAAMLAAAQQKADALLVEAQLQAEAIKVEAHEAGAKQGHADGLNKGHADGLAAGKSEAIAQYKQQMATLIQALSAAAGEIERSRQALLTTPADDITRLTLAIAGRIVHDVGRTHPQAVVATVSQALRYVVTQNDLTIALNPAQEATLQQAMAQLKLQWPRLGHVRIAGDDAIAPGGARLISGNGEVDATLQSMIERIASELIASDPGGGMQPDASPPG